MGLLDAMDAAVAETEEQIRVEQSSPPKPVAPPPPHYRKMILERTQGELGRVTVIEPLVVFIKYKWIHAFCDFSVLWNITIGINLR